MHEAVLLGGLACGYGPHIRAAATTDWRLHDAPDDIERDRLAELLAAAEVVIATKVTRDLPAMPRLRLLQVASQHDPLSLDVRREIGEVQLFSGRYAEAVEGFERLIDLDPDFPFARSYLARSLILSGRAKEALRLLEPGMPFLGLGRRHLRPI